MVKPIKRDSASARELRAAAKVHDLRIP